MKKFVPFFLVGLLLFISIALFVGPYNDLKDETNKTVSDISSRRNDLVLLDLLQKSTIDELALHEDVYSATKISKNNALLDSFFSKWFAHKIKDKKDDYIAKFKRAYSHTTVNTANSMFRDVLFNMHEPVYSIDRKYVTDIDANGAYSYFLFVTIKESESYIQTLSVVDYSFTFECKVNNTGAISDIVAYRLT